MIDITQKKFKLPFFWFLVMLFFITSGFLILYAFGYTFNPTRGIFVHAGSVTIKSNPQEVFVKMNEQDVSKRLNMLNNSLNINRIWPDEYLLKVGADGFKTWQKKIYVHSGFSTEFWNVLLVRENYEKTQYAPENVEDFFISPKEKKIALTRNVDGILYVEILNTSDNTSTQIFSSSEYTFAGDSKENIEWGPQSEKLIIPLMKDGIKEYVYYDIAQKASALISEISGMEKLDNVRWDSNKSNILYFISENNLYQMDVERGKESMLLIAESIASYDISGDRIYYFQLTDGLVYRKKAEPRAEAEQITDRAPMENENFKYKIIVYDKDKLVMRNENGVLYIFNVGDKNEYFRKISESSKGSQFSNDGKKLLFWDNREIYVYYLADWETQPKRSEDEVKPVTRYSQPISSVQWSSDYEHVIFTAGNLLKITELDDRDYRNTFDIIPLAKNESKCVINFSESKIYFIDDKDGSDTPLIKSIDFPEKGGLLGF